MDMIDEGQEVRVWSYGNDSCFQIQIDLLIGFGHLTISCVRNRVEFVYEVENDNEWPKIFIQVC